MSLSISQQPAQIGLQTTPAKLVMQTEKAILSMQQQKPRVNMQQEHVKVEIDQYPSRAEYGFKNPLDLAKETSQIAKQAAYGYMAKKSADGDAFAAIERGGNPIVEIAERDAIQMAEYDFGLLPTARPIIKVSGGVTFQPEALEPASSNGVRYQFQPGKLAIQYQAGAVQTYLRQKAILEFQFQSDNKIDTKV